MTVGTRNARSIAVAHAGAGQIVRGRPWEQHHRACGRPSGRKVWRVPAWLADPELKARTRAVTDASPRMMKHQERVLSPPDASRRPIGRHELNFDHADPLTEPES